MSRVVEDVHRPFAVLLALLLVLNDAGSASQAVGPVSPQSTTPISTGTAALSGVVVDGRTGTPVEDALVTLDYTLGTLTPGWSAGTQPDPQLTDGTGRFVFVNLRASDHYAINVAKSGYLDSGYGRGGVPTARSTALALGNAEWIPNLRVPLWRPGAISGTVLDEAGEPVVGIYVRSLARLRVHGRDELAAGPMVATDDRGMYRLAGLLPGRYLIQVPSVQTGKPTPGRFPLLPPPQDGRPRVYPPTFYPAARLPADASAIDVEYGDERVGVDIQLDPVPAVRVSGHVDGPSDALANRVLRLLAGGLDGLASGTETATAAVAPDGTFTFPHVPAGAYVIDAPSTISEFVAPASASPANLRFPPPPVAQGSATDGVAVSAGPPGTLLTTRNLGTAFATTWGRTAISVSDKDESAVVVKLRPAGTMTGRVIVESGPGGVRLASPGSTVSLEPADGRQQLGFLSPQSLPGAPRDEFAIIGLGPGEYFLRAGVSPLYVSKNIVWNGRDYTNMPFDAAATQDFSGVVVTITTNAAAIAGTVRSETGGPLADAAVIVFPADRAQWTNLGLNPVTVQSTISVHAGAYRIAGLPAGEYLAIAVDGALRSAWQAPAFLSQVESMAARVRIAWGETKTIDLKIVEVKR